MAGGLTDVARYAVTLAALTATACVSPRLDTTEGLAETYPWIETGRTARAEFVRMLGAPSVEFEEGHLAGWRLPGAGAFSRSPYGGEPPPPSYSLVVAFDESGIAARLRVIPCR